VALLKAVGIISSLTLVTRVLGYVRDLVIAAVMGAGALSDAFFVAFRLPNFLRRIFAEGAFSVSFVPMFSGKLSTSGEESALTFAREAQALLLLAVCVVTVLAEIFMPQLIMVFAPGFSDDPEKFNLTVLLTRITFPYLIFISIVALYGGVLNSLSRFAAFAGVPILLNLTLVVFILLLPDYVGGPAHALSYGVFAAGVFQLIFMVIACRKAGMRVKLQMPRITPDVKKLMVIMVPAVIGASVAQINLLVDTLIASLIPSTVSYLYYADRVGQLPLGVIGVAVGSALLPIISRQLQSGDREAAKDSMNRALEITLLFCLPSAMAFIIISEPIITLLFQRGEFSAEDSLKTAQMLAMLAIGLPAFMLVKVFAPGFYAEHDTKTPVKIAIICIIANLVFNALFFAPLQHQGITLATSLSSWLNAILLAVILYKRGIFAPDQKLKERSAKFAIATVVMGVALAALSNTLWHDDLHGLKKLIILSVIIGTSGGIFFAICMLTKAIDLSELRKLLKRRQDRIKQKSE
jgi:putative peptidoglycan lipid II flippase